MAHKREKKLLAKELTNEKFLRYMLENYKQNLQNLDRQRDEVKKAIEVLEWILTLKIKSHS